MNDSESRTGAEIHTGRQAPPAQPLGKLPRCGNPLSAHKFGADPYALVYQDRVYLYMTHDVLVYDDEGNVRDNHYGSIRHLSVISSSDLANWTDHGEIAVAGSQGAAAWASQSWAPAAVHKVIEGRDQFFLYFANNATSIGVLTSDSPLGPWVDPIGKPLLTRDTPGVESVVWLFDPAVLVDEDGQGYIYFGGGVPKGQHEQPRTARVMRLGEDMTSVIGEAAVIDAPYMFEDSGIHKYRDVYYYTYCTNFLGQERPEGSPGAGEIAYMTSSSPMGPWTYEGTILRNPAHFFGIGGNNHHAIFQFQNQWYIAYHAQTLSKAMGVERGYRSTHLNQIFFDDNGKLQDVQADYTGVPQLQAYDPYQQVRAVTFAWSAGVRTRPLAGEPGYQLALTNIQAGHWIALSQVDCGADETATFTAAVSNISADCRIELRLDHVEGELAGVLALKPLDQGTEWSTYSTLLSGIQGVHDLYLVFQGESDTSLLDIKYWQLSQV